MKASISTGISTRSFKYGIIYDTKNVHPGRVELNVLAKKKENN